MKKGEIILELEDINMERALTGLKTQYDNLVAGFSKYDPYFIPKAPKDNNELILALKRARIDLQQKERDLERMKKLLAKGSVTESEYERTQIGYDMSLIGVEQAEQAILRQYLAIAALEKDISIAKRQFEMLKVKAPFPGRIAGVRFEIGESECGGGGGCPV